MRRHSDRGVSLIVVAASLLFMFGLAAIVVDGGLGFSERRQAQSAADFSALAALSFARSCHLDPNCPISDARDEGAREAKDVVAGNLPGRSLDWDTCVDTDRPSGFIPSDETDCVSFTDNNDEARVVLPIDTIDTFFGRVLGISELSINAFAEAGQGINLSAAIVPFTPKGGGPEVCLFTNQAPQTVPPCDGPVSGHFGYLDIALYGNSELGTPSTCAAGNQNLKIALNTSLGSDHILTEYDSGDIVVNDHDACPNRSEDINELVIEPGSPSNVPTTQGLFSGVSGNIQGNSVSGLARLRCLAAPCVDVRGRSLDDRGLWSYLTDPSCANDHATMEACLDAWSGGVIFDATIADNLRFVAVPELSSTANPLRWRIDRFVPVWIETIYIGCNANWCATIHSPGETTAEDCPNPIDPTVWSCGLDSNQLSNSVEGVTAFQLDLDMLPQSIRDSFPGSGQARTTALTR